ncbi:TPA: AAA family ATPase [Serratia marcescens]|nr:AAA family ATPase [Serratia marcescens]HAT3713916.1 AAA family ATPase [Serratia marcescens]HEJ7103063.1 AAA family ATPase [Serratia marcescens]HEJ7941140.1 AAA family ATPase [Serratia marcescens]HEJ8110477.1 AAA family ATPase [Serratia marcescens]
MLTYININDFKSIHEEKLKLRPLTILTGANSSGKSSVIQAIMLVIKYSNIANRYSMEEVTRYLNDFSVIRNKKNNAKVIDLELGLDGRSCKIQMTPGVIHAPSGIDYSYEPIGDIDSPEVLYLNANRMGAQDQVVFSERRVGNSGEFLFSTYEKIKTNAVSSDMIKYPGSSTISYQLAEWLSYITQTESELVTELNGDKVKVSYKIKDLEGEVSPFNLGAGMSYISKVLIICLLAKKGDIVLIENPEVQLHPKSQALLGDFLTHIAGCGVQLIVETHCEHLINKIAYQVYDECFSSDSLVIHYKPSVDNEFISLSVDETGQFINLDGEITNFPSGFFDATLDELRGMR